MTVQLYLGDCLDVMAEMDADSVDSIVTDPPYGLSFMGKEWDHGVPGIPFWTEALRVAKPGAHLLAFGSTRTHHRLACAIEDAGWEIRDTVMWVYAQGFPKSLDVSKAIDKAAGAEREVIGRDPYYSAGRRRTFGDGEKYGTQKGSDEETAWTTAPATDAARTWDGWGTALKPSYEPIIVARKPIVGTVAANVLEYGTGAINIDGCRVGGVVPQVTQGGQRSRGGIMNATGGERGTPSRPHTLGRWPANLILTYAEDNELAGFPKTNGQSAARFFYNAPLGAVELLFCRAESIIGAWRIPCSNDANSAESSSTLSSQVAASALNDAAILASLGATRLGAVSGLSTSVTATEYERLLTTLITAILSIGSDVLRAPPPGRPIPNGCLASIVETPGQTDTTTIMISHWKSGGSADAATFDIMPLSQALGEAGSASRLRYCAKASKSDRDEGLDGMGETEGHSVYSAMAGTPEHGTNMTTVSRHNPHPTVKPTALMRWLVRLVTPPGGVVLDPFMGSGSTGKAAALEGFSFVGIEMDAEYLEIARRRIEHAQMQPTLDGLG